MSWFQVVAVELVVEIHGHIVKARHQGAGKLVSIVPEQGQEAVICGLDWNVARDVERFLGNVADEYRVVHVEHRHRPLAAVSAIDKLLTLQILGLDSSWRAIEPVTLGDVAMALLAGQQRGSVLRRHAVDDRQNRLE